MSAAHTIAHSGSEVASSLKNNSLLVASKSAASAVGAAVAGNDALSHTVSHVTLPVLGLTAAVSAAVTQIEYLDKMKMLAKFYSKELGAVLGKDSTKIKAEDLEAVARGSLLAKRDGNRVITEQISQSRRRRNLGVALSAISSVATLGLLELALPGIGQGLAAAAGAVQDSIVQVIAKGLIGLATYHAIKGPLHWLGDKLLDTDKHTTHERIEEISRDIKKGKAISKEQVFAVFVAANPDVAEVIVNKFGKGYDDLELRQKQQLTENLGKMMEVDTVTDAINGGRMDVAELAFVSVGQASGAKASEGQTQKKGVMARVKETLHHMTHADDKHPKRSFADRVRRQPADGLSHLERLEQSRSEGPATREV